MIASIRNACDWIANVAQVKGDALPENTVDWKGYAYSSWKGSVRGEYSAAEKTWRYFGPIWHTGQAVKALVLTSDFLSEDKYLQAARLGADFILANQVWDKTSPDHGLIRAFEDIPDKVNTSAAMECMHGLMMLADRIGSPEIWDRLVAAGCFLLDRMYMPEAGLFRDGYDPVRHEIVMPSRFVTKNNVGGRPLVEDAVLVRLFEQTGDERFLRAHVRISETLVADQNPPGNWIDYGPCNNITGAFHPRQTYWWSLPLLETYRLTHRREFLDTAIASGRFCENALRADGGWIRGFYTNNKTDSFGHATSGSACAAILWLELFRETGDAHWIEPAEKALRYCRKMQFTQPQDENLRGAILEKVLPPDGTDRSPYYLRDVGTIFFIMAGIKYLSLDEAQNGHGPSTTAPPLIPSK